LFPIKEIDVATMTADLANKDNVEIVDIRTPAEVSHGVIPNAKTLPMHLIPLKLDYFNKASGKDIIIYCRTGSRSAQACMFLNQQGVNNVYNLRGGIVSWASSGQPIEASPAEAIG